MATRRARVAIALMGVLVVATGCSGPASQTSAGTTPSPGATEGVITPTADDFPDATPGEIRSLIESSEAPLPTALTVSESLVSPGAVVEVYGFGDTVTSAQLIGAEGPIADIRVVEGQASFLIPEDSADGAYAVAVDEGTGILGMAVVTVVSEPAIRITAKDGLVATRSLDVQMDLPAALLIGGEASGGYYEPLGDMLVPIRRESVSTLADFLSSPLRLPPTASGSATLITFEGDNEGQRSNTVGLTACGERALLSGDMGQAGEVRAVWAGPAPGTTGTTSSDGSYVLRVEGGLVAVTEYPLDGDPLTMLALATCGGEARVTEDGPSPFGTFSPDGLDPDTWIGSSSGGIEMAVDGGIALCSPVDGGVEVTLLDDFKMALGVVATLEDYAGAGAFNASALVFDGTGGFSEGRISVDVAVGGSGSIEGRFAGTASGAAGDLAVDGAFRCELSGPIGLGEPPGLFASHWETGGHDACRLGLVQVPESAPAVGAAVARRMAAGVPLVEWNTDLDVQALAAAAEYQQQQGLGDGAEELNAARRILDTDYLVTVAVRNLPDLSAERRMWVVVKVIDTRHFVTLATYVGMGADVASLVALPGFETHAEKVARAGICGFLDPEEADLGAGEEQVLTFEVVDLRDDPVAGAEVSVVDREDGMFSDSCGVPEPTSGTTSSNGLFESTFTAADEVPIDCVESPRFRGSATTSAGRIETNAGRDRVDATVHVGSRWEIHAVLTAQTPSGPLTWRFGTPEDPGSLFIRPDGSIVGGAPGTFDGFRSCEVVENGVLTFKEPAVSLSASWLTYLSGELVDGEYLDLRFDASGWDSNWPPLAPECAVAGLSELGDGVLRIFAYLPDAATVHPVRLYAEATTVTFRIDGEALPDAEFTVTITPAPRSGS